MTDLHQDLSSLLAGPAREVSDLSRGVNPYAAPAEKSVEPARSDPYAALRQDADEREANDFGLPSISSLSSLRTPEADAERVTPPEPVLSEAVLVAAGLLEPETGDTTDVVTADAVPDTLTTAVAAAPAAGVSEVTFSDFLSEREPAEDADLTQIFAGLDPAEPTDAVWRRGDDDMIGSGTTPSRSAKRSLRLRRRAA